MAGIDLDIPELNFQKPDGSRPSRIEMEEQMRKVWPKIHWIRLKASKIYGLPRQAAFDMREATLRHWTLDEMIRRGQITGDVSGVDAQTYNDDASARQFIQSLQYLIQSGQAITPQEGEGVDMSFVPPPPPMGGQPAGAPQQQPMSFQPPVQQGYAQQPQMPPGPPQHQPMMPPGAPPQNFAPPMPGGAPPVPQYAPPTPGAGMPQMPSTPVPPMPGAPQMPPQGAGRRKRGGGESQQAAPVPPMPGPAGYAPPQPQGQFSPPGAPPPMPPGAPQGYPSAPPQQFAPPAQGYQIPQQQTAQVQQPQAAAVDVTLHQKLDQILANQQKILENDTRLSQEWSVLQAGLATWLRVTYQKTGAPDLRSILTELGIQFPQ